MEAGLLWVIRCYWRLVPDDQRRPCIFKVSCSKHVYQVALNKGLLAGLRALRFRIINCRNGYHLFEDPISGKKQMVLRSGQVIPEQDIAQRFFDVT